MENKFVFKPRKIKNRYEKLKSLFDSYLTKIDDERKVLYYQGDLQNENYLLVIEEFYKDYFVVVDGELEVFYDNSRLKKYEHLLDRISNTKFLHRHMVKYNENRNINCSREPNGFIAYDGFGTITRTIEVQITKHY